MGGGGLDIKKGLEGIAGTAGTAVKDTVNFTKEGVSLISGEKQRQGEQKGKDAKKEGDRLRAEALKKAEQREQNEIDIAESEKLRARKINAQNSRKKKGHKATILTESSLGGGKGDKKTLLGT